MVVELTNTLLRETTPMTRRTTVPLLIVAVMCLLAAPAFAQEKPTAMPHDTAGKETCLMCHTAGAMEPVPDVPAAPVRHASGAMRVIPPCRLSLPQPLPTTRRARRTA